MVDTDVYSSGLLRDSVLAERYQPLLAGRPPILCFQTLAELRYGASLRGWGTARLRRLEALIAAAKVIHSGPDLISAYIELRVACERQGHGLAQREHDADRWIAATAIRLGVPLVSNDGIFEAAPGLKFQTVGGE